MCSDVGLLNCPTQGKLAENGVRLHVTKKHCKQRKVFGDDDNISSENVKLRRTEDSVMIHICFSDIVGTG